MKATQANDKILLPGQEYPEKNENQTAEKIVKLLKDQMLRMYAKNTAKQLRQIHPKMNGCVKAEFIIEKNLPGIVCSRYGTKLFVRIILLL